MGECAGRKNDQGLGWGDCVKDKQHLGQPWLRWLTASGEGRVKGDATGKAAHTIITPNKRYGRYSLLGAELRTGRTHQIRVHLASCGYPIVGDDKYGSDEVRAYFAGLEIGRAHV